MRPVVTDRVPWSVGPSVCRFVTLVSPAKMAEPIETSSGLRSQVGHGNYVLDGSRSPMGRDTFERERGVPLSYCKVQEQSAVICAKTAEPIEMPFGLWARMGPRNYMLDESPEVLRNVAMATNFGIKIAL